MITKRNNTCDHGLSAQVHHSTYTQPVTCFLSLPHSAGQKDDSLLAADDLGLAATQPRHHFP